MQRRGAFKSPWQFHQIFPVEPPSSYAPPPQTSAHQHRRLTHTGCFVFAGFRPIFIHHTTMTCERAGDRCGLLSIFFSSLFKYCNSIVDKLAAVLLPMAFSYPKNRSIHTSNPSAIRPRVHHWVFAFQFSFHYPLLSQWLWRGWAWQWPMSCNLPFPQFHLSLWLALCLFVFVSLSLSLPPSLPLCACASASEVAVLSRGDRVNHDWLAREEGDILIKRPQRCSAIMQIEC